jgi:hypothetical protein
MGESSAQSKTTETTGNYPPYPPLNSNIIDKIAEELNKSNRQLVDLQNPSQQMFSTSYRTHYLEEQPFQLPFNSNSSAYHSTPSQPIQQTSNESLITSLSSVSHPSLIPPPTPAPPPFHSTYPPPASTPMNPTTQSSQSIESDIGISTFPIPAVNVYRTENPWFKEHKKRKFNSLSGGPYNLSTNNSNGIINTGSFVNSYELLQEPEEF